MKGEKQKSKGELIKERKRKRREDEKDLSIENGKRNTVD